MTVYAKITNNQLQCYASWAFEGYNKVYDDLVYYDDSTKYKIIDGELSDITSTAEYQKQQFYKAKQLKLLENKQALENKESFNTSLGELKINTPIGRIDVVVTSMLNLVQITQQPLEEGFLRTYIDGVETPSPEMSIQQVGAFYLEVAQKIKALDNAYKEFEGAINSASTQDELDAIEIDYSGI